MAGPWKWPLTLVLAGANLFAIGLCLEEPWARDVRLVVVSGQAAVDGRPARAAASVRPGSALATREGRSSVTLLGGGARMTLTSGTEYQAYEAELQRRGRVWGGFDVWRLTAGQVTVKPGASSGGVVLTSDLGLVRAREAVFELAVAPILSGAAIDTPRRLRLSVASGRAELLPAGRRGPAVCVSAGVAAGIVEGCPEAVMTRPLLASEWESLLGRTPNFADPRLPAAEIPRGVWVPRWPGRNGPLPGSRGAAAIGYSGELRGGVLPGLRPEEDSWCYDAPADRWRTLPAGVVPPLAPSPKIMPRRPGREAETSWAWSPRAAAGLACADGRTWTWRPGEPGWRLLDPPNNPPPRSRAALYYDPAADLFVLFGGTGPGGACGDVWVLRL